MKLSKLLKNVKYKKIINYYDNEVLNLCDNSKKSTNNSLFFVIDGLNTNGEIYINEAINNGVNTIVCDKELNYNNITQIIVDDVRKSMSIISDNFYQNKSKSLKLIGIVGTNGKTSTSMILYNILKTANKKVGVIGTNQIIYNDKIIKHSMTTPDTIFLHKIFFDMKNDGIDYVIMEVSAHAIFLNKIYGLKFEYGIFTNFSQDHLDFFKTMENYKNVKKSFFNKNIVNYGILNIDDKVGKEILDFNNINCITYGVKNPSDVFAANISMNLKGSNFIVNYLDDILYIQTNLTCMFNIYNILSCICCAKLLKIDDEIIISSLKNLKQIDGRFNLLNFGQNFNIIVDYAHTPDSLKNLLISINSLNKNKTITVFGCPGNRDELKREIMGEIAGKYSDYVILTSDNPLYENSYRIMRDIEQGVYKTNCPYKLIDNRSDAISLAISLATPKSNLVVVGKGNEQYQNINGEYILYNDYEEISKKIDIMKKLKLENKFLY